MRSAREPCFPAAQNGSAHSESTRLLHMLSLACVMEHNSHQLCFIFVAYGFVAYYIFVVRCLCKHVFIEAGVFRQNKSLNVLYEFLTASG